MFTFPESTITNPDIALSDFYLKSSLGREIFSIKDHHHNFFRKLYRNKKLQERYERSVPVNFIVCPRLSDEGLGMDPFKVEDHYLDHAREDHINFFVHSNRGHVFTPWIAYHRLFHLIAVRENDELEIDPLKGIERYIYGEFGDKFMKTFNANLEQSKVKTIQKVDNDSELLYRNGIKASDYFDIDAVNVIDRMNCKSARSGILYTRPLDDLFPELYASYMIKGTVDLKKFESDKLVRSYKNKFGSPEFHEIQIDVDLANELLGIAEIQLQDDFDQLNQKYIGKSFAV